MAPTSAELGLHSPDVAANSPRESKLRRVLCFASRGINVLWHPNLILEQKNPIKVVLDERSDVALEWVEERPATPCLCIIDRVLVLRKKRQE